MKLLDFDVGDTVWLHCGQKAGLKWKWFPYPHQVPYHIGGNERTEGKVILEFQRQGVKYYVVEVQTSIEPVLYIREGWTLSDAADKPIGMFRR